MLCAKFNQDALEQHFSMQRGVNGPHTNPDVGQYQYNSRRIHVAGHNMLRPSRHGNCGLPEYQPQPFIDDTPSKDSGIINSSFQTVLVLKPS